MSPSQLPQPHIAHDALPKGYLGAIYGHPIVQGEPPADAPRSDMGGVWNMKEGTYRPPRGGKWMIVLAEPTALPGPGFTSVASR